MRLHMNRDRLQELVTREPDHVVSAGRSDLPQGDSAHAPQPGYRTFLYADLVREADPETLPTSELVKFGWVSNDEVTSTSKPDEILQAFLAQSSIADFPRALLRHATNSRRQSNKEETRTRGSRLLWLVRLLDQATNETATKGKTTTGLGNFPSLTRDDLRNLAKLSAYKDGPKRAIRWLSDNGISVITQKHLSYSRLDGAAVVSRDGAPVIGLTLRHDRLDSFWFTLLHELGHVMLHLPQTEEWFLDDLENVDDQDFEKEANFVAREALVPSKIWNRSLAAKTGNTSSIEEVARRAEVHPAIVAGRYRYETRRFSQLSSFVNRFKIRDQFY